LLGLAEDVAARFVGIGLGARGKPLIRVVDAGRDYREFAAGATKTLVRFRLVAAPQSAGRCVMRTEITSFKTRQEMFLGIVPTSPKQLVGYELYERFMSDYVRSVAAADRTADIAIQGKQG
jgi:hypothetical protein